MHRSRPLVALVLAALPLGARPWPVSVTPFAGGALTSPRCERSSRDVADHYWESGVAGSVVLRVAITPAVGLEGQPPLSMGNADVDALGESSYGPGDDPVPCRAGPRRVPGAQHSMGPSLRR